VKQIYQTLFGVVGNKVVPGAALFPEGKPPTKLPKISPATKPKEASK
jgi:penicillin-binding protein 2